MNAAASNNAIHKLLMSAIIKAIGNTKLYLCFSSWLGNTKLSDPQMAIALFNSFVNGEKNPMIPRPLGHRIHSVIRPRSRAERLEKKGFLACLRQMTNARVPGHFGPDGGLKFPRGNGIARRSAGKMRIVRQRKLCFGFAGKLTVI